MKKHKLIKEVTTTADCVQKKNYAAQNKKQINILV